MSKIIGIDLESIISIEELTDVYSARSLFIHYENIINSMIEKKDRLLYLFVPILYDKKQNSMLKEILNLYSDFSILSNSKIVYYQDDLRNVVETGFANVIRTDSKGLVFNDFIGAIREFRTDVLITSERKLLTDFSDDIYFFMDDITSALGDRNRDFRVSNQYKVSENFIEEKENYLLTDFLPDYTKVIALGKNEDHYSDSEKIYFANDLYHAVGILPLVEQKIDKRTEDIFKAYEYVPKTGIVSIDQEWKPYWVSSKFENNIYDSKLQQMSRLDFLKYHNRFNLDEVAIKYINEVFEVEITWEEFFDLADQCCHSFLELGLQKGDAVTVCMPNTIEDYVVCTALNHIGAIVNPIHPLSTAEKIERYFNAVRPRMFVGTDMPKKPDETTIDLESLMDKYGVEKSLLVTLVDLAPFPIKAGYHLQDTLKKVTQKDKYRDDMRYKMPSHNKKMTFSELLKLGSSYKDLPDIEHHANDIAYYYSTGGTTSEQPKIVSVPYSMLNTVYYNSYGIQVEKGDAVLINYPRYIAFSDSNCTHLPASVGMKMVFTPYEYPENCAQIFQDEQIKVLQVAPQFYEMMLEDESKGSFDGIDLSSIKYLVAGGDKWENDLRCRLRDMLRRHGNTDASFIVGYGNTELNGSAFVQLFDTNQTTDDSSIGIPLPPFKIKLVDEDGQLVTSKEQRGRLYVGGENVCMGGYLGDPDATREVLVEDNMYDTADIIEFTKAPNHDANNVVGRFITREKRFVMITQADRSGKAIPDDIEREITSRMDEVRGCCVVGVKDDNVMKLKAAVVLHDDVLETEELKEKVVFVSQQKDIINTISEVKFVSELPLTDRQKVNYRQVEEMFTQSNIKQLVKKK